MTAEDRPMGSISNETREAMMKARRLALERGEKHILPPVGLTVGESKPEEIQGFVEFKEGELFELNEEMKRFLAIEEITGGVYKLEIESEQRRFVRNFNAWIKAGRPRPGQVKLIVEEDPIVHAIYRIKVRGIQKIYWVDERGKVHGKVLNKVAKQVRKTDPRTGAETIVDLGYRDDIEYTQLYTKELAQKLIDDAMQRGQNPQFYYHDGNHPWSCHPEDLLIPNFDEGLKQITTKGYGMTPSIHGSLGPTQYGRKY